MMELKGRGAEVRRCIRINILYVIPWDTTYKYKTAFIPSLSYQPLTLSTLAALTMEKLNAKLNANITLVDEGVMKFDYTKTHYDIVGISVCTSSSTRGYELADYFKARGSYVIIGGHHATLLPNEAAEHADSVFTGPAEFTLSAFFEDYIRDTPKPFYHADGGHTGGVHVDKMPIPRRDHIPIPRHDHMPIPGSDHIPIPRRDHIPIPGSDHIPIPRRDLMPKKGYLKQPTIIADYGCGNSCKYCVIHSFWGGSSRQPISAVVDEIKSIGAKEYIFLDPSPLSNRTYAKELFEALIPLRIKWAGLSTLDISDDGELLAKMAKSGCIGTLLGFETFNADDLRSMNKYKNKIGEYSLVTEKLHEHGIAVLGTFMLGLDGDTKDSLRELPDLIAEVKIDVPRFAILTPYPNTPLFNELESKKRILHRDWSKYDSVHCIFKPKNMSASELESEHLDIWKRTYSTDRILSRLRFTPKRMGTVLITNIGFKIFAHKLRGLVQNRI